MAPKRVKRDESLKVDEKSSTTVTTRDSLTRRVTRSSTAAAAAALSVGLTSLPKVQPQKKKPRISSKQEKKVQKEDDEKAPNENNVSFVKTVIIEHCKQCNAFKTRAIQVKEGLEKGVSGINVVINPDKPRRGCFEVREEGGETFITLLDPKRPFNKLKALEMEEVISDIIKKIK